MSTPLLYKVLHDKRSPVELREPLPWLTVDLVARSPLFIAKDEPPLELLYPRVEGGKPNPYCFFIGTTDYGTPFCWDITKPKNPLMLILGMPGAGKSALVKTIVNSILCSLKTWGRLTGAPQPPVLILDPEGEYHVLKFCPCVEPDEVYEYIIPEVHTLNLFDRPSRTMKPLDWYLKIGAMIYPFIVGQSPAQSPLAYIAFKEAIREAARSAGLLTSDPREWARRPDITLGDVIDVARGRYEALLKDHKTPKARRLQQGYSTLVARLSDWEHPPGSAFTAHSSLHLGEAMRRYRVVILRVRGLPPEMFNMFAWWLASWTYALMLQRGPLARFRPRLFLVLDEAWILLKQRARGRSSPLEELSRRARKYGIVTIVATQTVEEVSRAMFSLFGTVVVGQIRSAEQVRRISESLGWPEVFARRLQSLSTGQMVWSVAWRWMSAPFSGVPIVVRSVYPVPEDTVVVQA